MSFWSGEKLLDNQSVVTDFNPDQVDANAYNLKMGDCYFTTSNSEHQTKVYLEPGQPFVIPSGQFAYLMSQEELNIPSNAMAFISMRTGIKFKGLINVSGFHVDPGYKGRLIYAAYNASPSPLHISEGEQIFKIWFVDLDRESTKEHLFVGNSKAEISSDLMHGMSKEIYSLQSLAEKIRQLETNLKEQKSTTNLLSNILTTLFITLFVGAILSALALFGPTLLSKGQQLKDYFNEEALSAISSDVETPKNTGQ